MPPEAPDARTRPIAPALLEQAADWLLRLHECPDDPRIRQDCLLWCQATPENARAWAKAEQLQGLIDKIPAELALPVLDRPIANNRRRVIKHLAMLAVLAGPGLWAGHRLWQSQSPATMRTAIGQRHRRLLPDGTRLDLASDTTIEINYGDQLRQLRLQHGEIAIETVRDPHRPARPFVVTVPQGTLQALGTRFDVRLESDGNCRLVVLGGAVRVTPARDAGAITVVEAGQCMRFHASGMTKLAAADGSEMTWRDGMIAADAMPLSELVAELARYRRGVLRCDPAVATLRVSGAFPLDDTDRSLAMIAAILPVSIQRRAGGWWTRVGPRRDEPSGEG